MEEKGLDAINGDEEWNTEEHFDSNGRQDPNECISFLVQRITLTAMSTIVASIGANKKRAKEKYSSYSTWVVAEATNNSPSRNANDTAWLSTLPSPCFQLIIALHPPIRGSGGATTAMSTMKI